MTELLKALDGHPIWKFFMHAMAIVGVIAGVVAAVAGVAAVRGPSVTDPTTNDVAVPSVEPLTSTPTPTASGNLVVGDCLDNGRLPVSSCDFGHRYEVVAVGECSAELLIRYLGGDPGIEILRAAHEELMIASSAQRICVVDDPTADVSIRSARDVLTTPTADGWRLCRDSRTSLDELSCAEPHTGEYVKSRTVVGTGPINCSVLAEQYMNLKLPRVSNELAVRAIRADTGPDCLVEVLGNNVLTKSVRNLGTKPVPREPG